jgi:beta-N-acetylhexosaminidase
MIRLRRYQPETDASAVFDLYRATLEERWPIAPNPFHRVLTGSDDYRFGDHAVAQQDGRIVGFVATQVRRTDPPPKPQGGIALLMVHPDFQRRKIGSRLHDYALLYLSDQNMKRAQLGAGAGERFWNGVPSDLTAAVPFFEARGWEFTETAHDLTRSLHDYETPDTIRERLAQASVVVQPATPEQVPLILAFEERAFPNWFPYFRDTAERGRPDDLLAAWNREGEVVGSLLMFSKDSPHSEMDRIWQAMLGADMGGLGCVGVAESERERGIGLGMVARASEILRERGVGNCHVGWTWLLDWYGQLGYQPWRSFEMAWRDLH